MDKKAALNVVEEQVETLERIPKLHLNGTTKSQQIVILGATAVVSAVAGGIVAYKVASKKLQTKYEQIAEREIAEAKKFYGTLHKTDADLETPVAALKKYVGDEVIDELQYRSPLDGPMTEEEELLAVVDKEIEEETKARLEQVEEKVVEVVKNVFDDAHSDGDFDYDYELAIRIPGVPYILSQEEFMLNEPEYDQNTLTYFEGDDVLTDSRDVVINESETTVGDANLLRFGHGSKDNNVIYIRNEKLEIDFEVVRSMGEYTKEVLGFIQHDDRPGVRRFRSGDG